MSRPIVEAFAAELSRAGVDTLFGLPGGGPNLDMVGAAGAAGARFVLAHGETAACIMAGTYGLLTGQPGVCVVTRGPGVASAANGLAQATLDRFPLLLVSDAVPGAEAHRTAHQRFDQTGLTAPVTKWSGTLGERNPGQVVAAALALATQTPAGAVHLDFDPTSAGDEPPGPGDELPGASAGSGRRPGRRPGRSRPAGAGAEELRRARAVAERARRPVLLLGAEAIPAVGAVRELVDGLGCPVLTTYHARGAVGDSSPNAAGLFTGGALERSVLERSDLVVAVGVDPAEPIPAPWPYRMPVLLIHPWEITDAYFAARTSPTPPARLIGPVEDTLAALAPCLRSEWEPGAGRAARRAAERALEIDSPAPTPRAALPPDDVTPRVLTPRALTPHDVVDVVRRTAPAEARVTVDAGAHMLVAMPLWPAEEPRRVLISNGLATMGFALPAAVGAALADPARPVICLVGDGGLGTTLAELETVARLDLDVTVVVFNDAALSLIEIKQRPQQGGAAAVRYRPSDFAQVARGLGLWASVATDAAELERELATRPRGPRLIDARTDPTAYRHVIAVTRG